MPRLTAIQKLRKELSEAHEVGRNANSTLAYVRGERDRAREERDTRETKNQNAMAMIQSQQRHIRDLFRKLYLADIRNARGQGYIDRVRELDKAVVEPVQDIDVGQMIERDRTRLAEAHGDRAVDRILDTMDSDILDQVLGRGADD